MDKVEKDTEIFKPRVQDSNDFLTKDITKVNIKHNKDNASLKFDGLCIKTAKVCTNHRPGWDKGHQTLKKIISGIGSSRL